MEDKLVLGGKEFSSRFILGSGKYNINLLLQLRLTGGSGNFAVGKTTACTVTHGKFLLFPDYLI